MKQVYILMSSYYNGCDIFESIVDVYADEDVAGLEQLRLEEYNQKPDIWEEGQSWFVTTWEVK